MTYRIEVAVPMRDGHAMTRELCRSLAVDGDFDRLRIYDNGSEGAPATRWLDTIERTGRYGAEVVRWGPRRGIYAMWNDALLRAFLAWRQTGVRTFAAILNNDLEVPPGFLRELGDALEASPPNVWITYPDWLLGWPSTSRPAGELRETIGTRNLRGMSGYAFLVDVEVFEALGLPLIDEGFVWYCGDGELVTNLEERGGTAAAVVGLPVGHVERATSREHPWTVEQGRRDRARARRLAEAKT